MAMIRVKWSVGVSLWTAPRVPRKMPVRMMSGAARSTSSRLTGKNRTKPSQTGALAVME